MAMLDAKTPVALGLVLVLAGGIGAAAVARDHIGQLEDWRQQTDQRLAEHEKRDNDTALHLQRIDDSTAATAEAVRQLAAELREWRRSTVRSAGGRER